MTDLSSKSTAELVTIYNAKAAALNRPLVKRFADRATAEKRVAAITAPNGGVAEKSRPAARAGSESNQPGAKKPKVLAKPDALVRSGSYRDKLLATMEAKIGTQQPVSALMKATYGEARKDFKGPIMMVMKGLRGVLAASRKDLEIRKTRDNKENCFGLHKKNG
jgi:hypothetical protein